MQDQHTPATAPVPQTQDITPDLPDTLAQFNTLQMAVTGALDSHWKQSRLSMFSRSFLLDIGYTLILVLCFGLFLFFYRPYVQILIDNLGNMLPPTFKPFKQTLSFVSTGLSTGILIFWFAIGVRLGIEFLRRLITKYKQVRTFIYFFVFIPLWTILTGHLINYLSGTRLLPLEWLTTTVIWYKALFTWFLVACLPVGMLLIALLMLPNIVWLVLSDTSIQKLLSILPSHEEINQQVIGSVSHIVRSLSDETLREIQALAQIQREHNNLQGQAFALALATLGLLSLAFSLGEDRIQLLFDAIGESLLQLNQLIWPATGGGSDAGVEWLFFAIIVFLVVIGWLYFSHAYIFLRGIEIIDIACTLELNAREAHRIHESPSLDAPIHPLKRFFLRFTVLKHSRKRRGTPRAE